MKVFVVYGVLEERDTGMIVDHYVQTYDVFSNKDEADKMVEWLTELKQWRRVYGVCPSYEMCISECKEGYDAQIAEYKRLLKSAVNDMNSNNFCHRFDSCKVCSKKYNISCDKKFQWRYTDRFEKLIGDESNGI